MTPEKLDEHLKAIGESAVEFIAALRTGEAEDMKAAGQKGSNARLAIQNEFKRLNMLVRLDDAILQLNTRGKP